MLVLTAGIVRTVFASLTVLILKLFWRKQ